MSRAELFWLSYLYLLSCHREEQIVAATRWFFSRYETPQYRKLEALMLRPSPMLQAIDRAQR